MRIGVIGASGFIGKAFCSLALGNGHEVVGFSRSERHDERENMSWRVFGGNADLSGLDAIVNYAGDSIAQRWSEEKKKSFYESRGRYDGRNHRPIY